MRVNGNAEHEVLNESVARRCCCGCTTQPLITRRLQTVVVNREVVLSARDANTQLLKPSTQAHEI